MATDGVGMPSASLNDIQNLELGVQPFTSEDSTFTYPFKLMFVPRRATFRYGLSQMSDIVAAVSRCLGSSPPECAGLRCHDRRDIVK